VACACGVVLAIIFVGCVVAIVTWYLEDDA
jgi:hypothetical protein